MFVRSGTVRSTQQTYHFPISPPLHHCAAQAENPLDYANTAKRHVVLLNFDDAVPVAYKGKH